MSSHSNSSKSSDEYRSFAETIAKADSLAQKGRAVEADQFYRLALMKGQIIRDCTPERTALADVEPTPESDTYTPSSEPLEPFDDLPVPTPVPLSEPPAPPEQVQPDAQSTKSPVPGLEIIKRYEPNRIVGMKTVYTVKKGDTLPRIGARLGLDWRVLAKRNGLDTSQTIRAGQALYYDNHKIVPKKIRDGMIINIPDRTLYLFKRGVLQKAYPVAAGRADKSPDDTSWQTPLGKFTISAKHKDPTWNVPVSIQKEMERKGEKVITEVPPGEKNPLGKYALSTSMPGIMIHSTVAPSSIYTFSSHGCIRVIPDHMEELFQAVAPRTQGEIVYEPVKLLAAKSGQIFLEVHRDVYNVFKGGLLKETKRLINGAKLSGKVDWHLVDQAVKQRSGMPVEVTALPLQKTKSTGSLAQLQR